MLHRHISFAGDFELGLVYVVWRAGSGEVIPGSFLAVDPGLAKTCDSISGTYDFDFIVLVHHPCRNMAGSPIDTSIYTTLKTVLGHT